MWRLRGAIDEAELKALTACVLLGTIYGAVCGVVYVVLLGAWEAGWDVPIYGGLGGGVLGGASGFMGASFGGRLGWCLAGVLGGSPLAVVGWLVSLERPDALDPVLIIPSIIGGCLGLAIGIGLQKGRSRLPGVERLGKVINEAHPPRLPGRPAEVTPARAPQGRGDEATAAEPNSVR